MFMFSVWLPVGFFFWRDSLSCCCTPSVGECDGRPSLSAVGGSGGRGATAIGEGRRQQQKRVGGSALLTVLRTISNGP